MRAEEPYRLKGLSVDSLLGALVLIASAGFVLLYAILVLLRVRYPFELEWLEGAAVDHVRTILAGEPLYATPSLRFIPLTYTPGYFYLGAAVSALMGEGFLPLRLISIVASAGVFVLIYRLASREVMSPAAGLLAIGLFAGTYGWTDGWFDLARTDSLMLFLALWAIYVLRWIRSTGGAIAAGVLISLCFLVKQTGFIIAIPLAVYSLFLGWRSCLAFAGTVAVIVVGTTAVFDRVFDGWYRYYVVDVPAQHPLAYEVLYKFWRFDLLRPLPLALAVAPVFLLWRLRRSRETGVFYLLLTAALFGGALASRLHSLSYINVVLPAYAALAILGALALHHGVRAVRDAGVSTTSAPRLRRLAPAAMYSLALLQLLRLSYAPASLVPTAEDVAVGRAFLASMAAMPGDIFVPYHGYLPSLAGKPSHAHAVVIADVIRGGVTDVEKNFARELDDALRTHRFQSIVTVEAPTSVRGYLPIDEYYRPAEAVIEGRSRFWRREIRYLPR